MRRILLTIVLWVRSTSMVWTPGFDLDGYSVLHSNADKEIDDYSEHVLLTSILEAM